ncbi:hypothetical protein MKZ38_004805 [Zalerion maritima]|uniref:F-box domain-containing protein n=1 Tax=Zalerion maritima TaxID=339359 RepID=A0AAD5RL16_9PEZI|nr:hypothetical protein MKZ38_004805 [Zalerion maritima]
MIPSSPSASQAPPSPPTSTAASIATDIVEDPPPLLSTPNSAAIAAPADKMATSCSILGGPSPLPSSPTTHTEILSPLERPLSRPISLPTPSTTSAPTSPSLRQSFNLPPSRPTISEPTLTINDLPEDILVLVLSHLSVWDIFHLRLTTKVLLSVINSSVKSVSRKICLNTFPDDRMLAKRPANGNGEWDFDWLRDRIPRKLAAVLLDHGERGIPAESEWGEVARYRVARGWKVLKRLSREMKDVEGIGEEDVLGTGLRPGSTGSSTTRVMGSVKEESDGDDTSITENMRGSMNKSENAKTPKEGLRLKGKVKDIFRKDLTLLECRQELALVRCRQVISSLRKCDALGFMLLWDRLVCGPFRAYFGPFDELHEDCVGRKSCLCPSYCGTFATGVEKGESGSDNVITLERGNCWMTWFILRNGPGIFFRQWCSREASFAIGDEVHKEWKARSKREVEIERYAAARIWAGIWMRAWCSSSKGKKGAFSHSNLSSACCSVGNGSSGGIASPSELSKGGGSVETFNPSRILKPEYLWWDDSINQGGLGSTVMPWMSFMFEEQPMWQELYDDYGSLPIRGQVLWLLWQQGKIRIDEEFDVEEMLATAEDVDDLLDAFWTYSILQPGFGVVNYGVGGLRGQKGSGRRRRRLRGRLGLGGGSQEERM